MAPATLDLTSAQFRSNPYPTYETLRQAGGVHWLPHGGPTGGMWLISRYDDVAELLKTRKTSKHVNGVPVRRCPYDHNLLSQDAPDHTRIRSLVVRAFSSERIAALEPAIRTIVDELLDPMIERGSGDFIEEFAGVLPAYVIADLMGVPRSDHVRFSAWARDLLTGPDVSNPRMSQVMASIGNLTEFFRTLVAQRRRTPTDDFISALTRECDVHDRVSNDEMLAALILILVAGHETVVNMLANGMWILLDQNEPYRLLQRNPDLVPGAIEEIMRFESPVQRATFRTTTESMTISGVDIGKNQQISAVIGSANRDAEYFNQPEQFDIERRPNRHLGFGSGIHACLGPALARLEGKVAFQRLFERTRELRLADPQPHWNISTGAMRGLTSLPVLLS
ncbi:cytochrome P450 [Paraburkholderia sediminicola]|uniref:Cytochrome P450 n=1 Tax=Paraburkholderia metrosideri TaxID=580937 RepID=A0ABW9DQW0_9BURK